MRSLVNGREGGTVSMLDRALHYGDGLFETVAVEDGEPLCLPRHLQRLRAGCERLAIPAPFMDELAAEIRQVARGQGRAVCKVLVSRGTGARGYRPPERPDVCRIVLLYPWPAAKAEHGGARVGILEACLGRNPALAGLKHLNRLEQVVAAAELATRSELDEGLMRDSEGLIIEGTMSNIFGVRRGGLMTPDLGRCGVAGIVRAQLIDVAEQVTGKACDVVDITPDDLRDCDELFLCNSTREVWPVVELDGASLSPGPVTLALRDAVYALRRAE